MHGPLLLTQVLSKVPHPGQEQGDPQLMTPDVRGFLRGFGHPDGVVGGGEVLKDRRMLVELIAENHDEMTHHQVSRM